MSFFSEDKTQRRQF